MNLSSVKCVAVLLEFSKIVELEKHVPGFFFTEHWSTISEILMGLEISVNCGQGWAVGLGAYYT